MPKLTLPKRKPRLESSEERSMLRYIKEWGLPVLVRKLNGTGYRSWPDRMILGPKKFFRMLELKRKKLGRLSEGQADLFEELEKLEHHVPIFDDGKMAAEWIRDELQKAKLIK